MQLQLGSEQAERPRLAVIECVCVCVCVSEEGGIEAVCLFVSWCLCMSSPEHKYTPNQFKLGHLLTQSNVP